MHPHAQPLHATLAAFVFTLMPLAAAYALTPAEQPYVGHYTQPGISAPMHVMLLDDNTFCLTLVSGSIELVAGGHWKAEGDGVRLQEVRQDAMTFPVFGKTVSSQKESVEFDFHGYSLAGATSAVFATGSGEGLPTSMRPLFQENRKNRANSYKLPPMPAAQVRYFYIGDAEVDANRQAKRLRVVQYPRGDANALRVGYNWAFGSPPLNLKVTLKSDGLHWDGAVLVKRNVMSKEILEGVRAACIRPALMSGAKRLADESGEKEAANKAAVPVGNGVARNAPLAAVKIFYLPLTAIQGPPYFPGTEK